MSKSKIHNLSIYEQTDLKTAVVYRGRGQKFAKKLIGVKDCRHWGVVGCQIMEKFSYISGPPECQKSW